MRTPLEKSWIRLVLCYWLLVGAIIYLELRFLESDWAGLAGFLFTLPFSALVVTGYFLLTYAHEVRGFNVFITEYQVEYGFLICAFLNGLISYPIFRWWRTRKRPRHSEPPMPPAFN
jgi:hypothetical protein